MQLIDNFMKTRRDKPTLASTILMVLFGLAFLAPVAFVGSTMRIDPGWVKTQGTITEVAVVSSSDGSTYAPVVTYVVDGVSYSVQQSFSSSSRPNLGGTMTVAYNPSSPSEAKVQGGTSLLLFLGLFAVVGISIIVSVIVAYIRSMKRSRDIDSLMTTGQKVQGIITNIQDTKSRGAQYKVVVSAPNLAGQVTHYVSDTITGIGAIAMMDYTSNPIPVDVFIDPTNPDRYYVDIADLPNLTPDKIASLITQSEHKAPPPSQPTAIF